MGRPGVDPCWVGTRREGLLVQRRRDRQPAASLDDDETWEVLLQLPTTMVEQVARLAEKALTTGPGFYA